MEKELRRLQDLLVMYGIGICIFGGWGVVKTVMPLILNYKEILKELASNPEDGMVTFIILLVMTVAFAIVTLGFHIYVGMSARRRGLGKKPFPMTSLVAALMIAAYILSAVGIVTNIDLNEETVLDIIVAVVIDITSVFSLVQIIITPFRIKKLRLKLAEPEVV